MRGTCVGRRISLAALSGRLGAFLAAKTRRWESDGPSTHVRVAINGSALVQQKECQWLSSERSSHGSGDLLFPRWLSDSRTSEIRG